MYKRLPPLNSLKAFECSARHLSFTKAAEELCVTQAAISHQIKLLEDFLGMPLFYRKNRTLELTELGIHYFADISKIFNRLTEATKKILSQKNDKHLAIAVPQTFGMQWLVPHLNDFHDTYSAIELRLNGVDQDEGFFKNNETDLAIYYGNGDWKHFQVEKLVDGELVILGAPQLLAQKPVYEVEDLIYHQLIHIHDYQNWQDMASYLQLDGLDIQHGALFSHTVMALQAAKHGQGLVLANKSLAQKEIEAGNLIRVLPEKSLRDPKSFYIVNQLDKASNEQINAFKQWILSTIRKERNE